MKRHPIHELDDDVHQRVRLGILAALHGLARADFNMLKTNLELTDGNLNRHLQALDAAGLIGMTKSRGSGRPRTWIKITAKGKRALREEIRALQELLGPLSSENAAPAERETISQPATTD